MGRSTLIAAVLLSCILIGKACDYQCALTTECAEEAPIFNYRHSKCTEPKICCGVLKNNIYSSKKAEFQTQLDWVQPQSIQTQPDWVQQPSSDYPRNPPVLIKPTEERDDFQDIYNIRKYPEPLPTTNPPVLTKPTEEQDVYPDIYNIRKYPEPLPTTNTWPTENPTQLSEKNNKCGISNENGLYNIYNIQANQAKPGQFPWAVALFNDGNYFAGGSLIKPGIVLTVAHWLVDKNETDLTVRAGEWDLSSENERFENQERQVQRMLLHDKFDYQSGANNLALLYLKDSFEFSDHIRTICVASPNKSFQGRRCTVAGWGKIKFNDQEYSSTLKKVDLTIIDNHQCEQQLRHTKLGKHFTVPENAICAGGELNQDACVGDGGSALFCPGGDESPGQYVQAGIVNWGVGCGQKDVPAMYTEVSKFYKWIQENSSGFTFRSNV
ncbi:phenoloxidase-activating factor 2-like [Drosophila ficusphila]|uniref:phenoloxidase-activating factor 2-like n=1 Tax=Drosophila ficusphila TaxID=30025 RepID=UPI001C89F028|nr:phenoloxidase-activating factor 2-like [Drosophila ficusphila]